MIQVRETWAIQVDVTSHCIRKCSNCTRCLGHKGSVQHMPVAQIAEAIDCSADFLSLPPDPWLKRERVIGIIGGEPLLHPGFVDISNNMKLMIPKKSQRGLWTGWGVRPSWTGKGPDYGNMPYSNVVKDVYGYLNWNPHGYPLPESKHTPVLAASEELVPDADVRYKIQDGCWLQETWSSAINIHGAYFCEVAAALDNLYFDGVHAAPVILDWWNRDLIWFFDYGQRKLCDKCGVSIPMKPRWDFEEVDDVTPLAAERLVSFGSRRKFNIITDLKPVTNWNPERYREDKP